MSADGKKREIALVPDDFAEYRDAIVRGGGNVSAPGLETQALVWSRHGGPEELKATLAGLPRVTWVQLPSAGVDNFIAADVLGDDIIWTSAKGAYAQPVAEHALTLTLALLRQIPLRVRASQWGKQSGYSLFGMRVLILGAGGIAQEFARLVAPFQVDITVCRRRAIPVAYANQTVGLEGFHGALGMADVVLLAAPLTAETAGIVSAAAIEQMKSTAVLVNVGRGGLIVTDDLVAALAEERIGGAALDVTDPEPLPPDHALWKEERVLITPHTADTPEMIIPLLANRIESNVARFLRGEPLLGVIDVHRGY